MTALLQVLTKDGNCHGRNFNRNAFQSSWAWILHCRKSVDMYRKSDVVSDFCDGKTMICTEHVNILGLTLNSTELGLTTSFCNGLVLRSTSSNIISMQCATAYILTACTEFQKKILIKMLAFFIVVTTILSCKWILESRTLKSFSSIIPSAQTNLDVFAQRLSPAVCWERQSSSPLITNVMYIRCGYLNSWHHVDNLRYSTVYVPC